MKKYIQYVFILLVCLCLVGCGQKDIKEDKKETLQWDDVKEDYNQIESSTLDEFNQMTQIQKSDLINSFQTIQDHYEKIKDGINEENEDIAKKVYKEAHRLELMEHVGDEHLTEEEQELLEIGDETKQMIQYHYGYLGSHDGVTDMQNDIEDKLKDFKNFTEDKWDQLVSHLQ